MQFTLTISDEVGFLLYNVVFKGVLCAKTSLALILVNIIICECMFTEVFDSVSAAELLLTQLQMTQHILTVLLKIFHRQQDILL